MLEYKGGRRKPLFFVFIIFVLCVFHYNSILFPLIPLCVLFPEILFNFAPSSYGKGSPLFAPLPFLKRNRWGEAQTDTESRKREIKRL